MESLQQGSRVLSSNYGQGSRVSLGFRQQQKHQLKQKLSIDPRVVMQGKLLELNQAELDAAVDAEMLENPALIRLDDPEPITQEEVLKKIAPQELAPSGDWHEGKRSLPSDDPTSWVELASSQTTLCEHLMASLLPRLPEELRRAGQWAIHSLDERGYLDISVEELAYESGCSLEEAAAVILALQECEPPGIGASTLRECLMLQLKGNDSVTQMAKQILEEGWEEFIAGRHLKLSRKFGAVLPLIKRACSRIKNLSPFPAETFNSCYSIQESAVPVAADLQIQRSETGWKITVQGVSADSLGIEHFYRKKSNEIKARSEHSRFYECAESKHILMYVKRASEFIEGVQVRHKTMHLIGAYLAQEQTGFLTTGSYRFLRSLTRSKMAKDLGLHESTVSRATAGKHIQMPSGEVVSFEVFFKPALKVQKMIEEILASENPSNPLSDEAIALKLAELDIKVARRTVHKYRDLARLSSSRRRRAA